MSDEQKMRELAVCQNREAAKMFGSKVASKLSGAAAEFGETCALLDSPEDAQRLHTLFMRQMQEFINTMAKLL